MSAHAIDLILKWQTLGNTPTLTQAMMRTLGNKSVEVMSDPSCSDGPAGPSLPFWFPELIPTDKQKGKAIRVYIYLLPGSSTTRAAEKPAWIYLAHQFNCLLRAQ